MSEQGKRAERRRQEDAAFNKMLLWLAICVAVEALTLLLRQLYVNFSLTDAGVAIAGGLSAFFRVFIYAGAVLTVAGVVWCAVWLRRGSRGKKMLLPAAVTGGVAWLWIASLLCFDFDFASRAGMSMLCAVPVAVAVLAAVYYLYQREFFCCAVLCGAGITALWVFKQIYMNHPRMTLCGFILVWVFLALCALAAYLLRGRKGVAFGERILPAKANYPLVFLTCAVNAAALAAALILGPAYAYYVMFVVIGWLFCLAVYYTVRLM